MTVYVVSLGDLYQDHLLSVFSSRQAAEQWIQTADVEEGEHYFISEMKVLS